MNNLNACPCCGKTDNKEQSYADVIEFKGIPVQVDDLRQLVCASCGYTFEPDAMHDENIDRLRAAFMGQRQAAKVALGRLTGEQIRSIRSDLGLSQKEAALLFRGGVNTFSRYETEEVVQPASMDILIRLVASLGKMGVDLVERAKLVSAVAPEVQPMFTGSVKFKSQMHGVYELLMVSGGGQPLRAEVELVDVEVVGAGHVTAPVVGQSYIARPVTSAFEKTFGVNPVTGAMYPLSAPSSI